MALVWGNQDAAYIKFLVAERHKKVGPTAEYYRLIRGENVDKLYNEPVSDPLYGGSPAGSDVKWSFADMVEFQCNMQYQEHENKEPSTKEEGMIIEWDAIMYVAQNNWDEVLLGIEPKEGDVVYVFEEWFTVEKEGRGGNILDTSDTTGYKLELRKRSEFTPDRKVNR